MMLKWRKLRVKKSQALLKLQVLYSHSLQGCSYILKWQRFLSPCTQDVNWMYRRRPGRPKYVQFMSCVQGVASTNFCQKYLHLEFLKNTCKGKEAWKLTERENSCKYFPWIWTSRESNEMVWLIITSIQVTTLLQKYWVEFGPTSNSCISSIQATNAFIWKILFFQFWETENSGVFSSKTAQTLSKTCSSLNLRKSCPLIKSYLLHMLILI